MNEPMAAGAPARPSGAPVSEARRLWRWATARFRGRADSEHEQALIRLAIYSLAMIYVALAAYPEADRPAILKASAVIYLLSATAALAILAWIFLRPAVSPLRRICGMALDCLSLNGAMLVGGEAAMVLFPFLLWTVLGHGFRFGRGYLFAAAVTAALLFLGVILLSPSWSSMPMLNVGLLLALVILPAYFAVLLRKLTDAIETAREASRAKSRFLATMSHEFRTPLNAVIGMAELLRTTRLDRDQRDMTATIRSAAGSLLAMVGDLLDAAKIEARQLTVEVEPLDLHQRLATVRAMLQHQASEKQLYLRLRLDPATPWRLVGGMRPLHQILVNLTANAIKFTEHGGVQIAVRPVELGDDGCRLRFEVVDTGIGIPDDQQQRVFERFTQVDGMIDRRYGGTGLGLAIARELVELQGGSMGLASRTGQGSTFWFELPFVYDQPGRDGPAILGDIVVTGSMRAATAALLRASAGQCIVHEVADETAAITALAAAPGRRMVVIAGAAPEIDPERLLGDIAGAFPAEPIDLLTIGQAGPGGRPALADLPADPDPALLGAAVRAALVAHEVARDGAGQAALPMARRPGRLLLVEDNRTNQRVVSRLLTYAGHEVEIASDGDEAVQRLTDLPDERFGLVLMDINMPGMSGIDTVKMLRFVLPLDAFPPIIAFSADTTEARRQEALSVGFSDYLSKPIDPPVLIETIDRILEARVPGDRPAAPAAEASSGAPPVPPATPDDGRLWVDRSRLQQVAALDHDGSFLTEVVEGFVLEAAEIVGSMDRAARDGDAGALRDLGHALRSCAGHVGAEVLRQRCLAWRTIDDHALLLRATTEVAALAEDLGQTQAALMRIKLELQPEGSAQQGGRTG